MAEIEITYDGPYNVVVQCTECGTERGSSVVTGTLHPSRTTFDHCENCSGYRDHEPVREAERGEYDGHLICDDCDQQFTNTMDVDLHDCPADSSDDEDDEDSPEVATDGGEDATRHVSDGQIETAIENNDDSDHPDALTVEEVRDALAAIDRSTHEVWGQWMDSIEDGDMTVVAETSNLLVVDTGDWNLVHEELKHHPELNDDEVLGYVLTEIMHAVAREHCDRNWGHSYPFVLRKPQDFDAGERYVEAVLAWLMDECGLSGGVALDYYMVEMRGFSQNRWATVAGKNQGTVSQNVRKANENVLR